MEDFDSIEKYLNEELSPSERLAFEEKIKLDTAFAVEVKLQKAMRAGIKDFFAEKLLEDFKEWDKEVPKHQTKTKQLFLRPLLAVAAVILLLVLVYVGLNYNQSFDNQAVFEAYYQTYPNYASNTVRGENEDKDDYQKAFALYSEGKFKEAIALFEVLKVEGDKYYEVNFYWALCYLEIGELALAQDKLAIDVLKSNPHNYTQAAHWYLALTHLKMNDLKSCKKQLDYLISKHTDYTQKAKELISKLP